MLSLFYCAVILHRSRNTYNSYKFNGEFVLFCAKGLFSKNSSIFLDKKEIGAYNINILILSD